MAKASAVTTHGAATQLSRLAGYAYEAAQSIKRNLRALYDTSGLTEDASTAHAIASQLDAMNEATRCLMEISEATFDVAKKHRALHDVMKPATIKKVGHNGTEIVEIGKGPLRAGKGKR